MKPNATLLFETSDKKLNGDVIFEEGELDEKATVANFATVQTEGVQAVERTIGYYNLDVIISVGYRVKSLRGTQFRQCATKHLNEVIKR